MRDMPPEPFFLGAAHMFFCSGHVCRFTTQKKGTWLQGTFTWRCVEMLTVTCSFGEGAGGGVAKHQKRLSARVRKNTSRVKLLFALTKVSLVFPPDRAVGHLKNSFCIGRQKHQVQQGCTRSRASRRTYAVRRHSDTHCYSILPTLSVFRHPTVRLWSMLQKIQALAQMASLTPMETRRTCHSGREDSAPTTLLSPRDTWCISTEEVTQKKSEPRPNKFARRTPHSP